MDQPRKIWPIVLSGIAALIMWGLSAMMNVWTGYTFGLVLSTMAGIFGGLFMLVTEFVVPLTMIYKRVTGENINLLLKVTILMAIALSVLSFWNGTSLGLSTSLAKIKRNEATGEAIDNKIEAKKLERLKYSITAEQSAEPIKARIESLYKEIARNYAGQVVYLSGKPQTVMDATDNCNPNNEYSRSRKLYAGTCKEIAELNLKLEKILSSNSNIPINAEELAKSNNEQADLIQQKADAEFDNDTAIPMITMIRQEAAVKCDSAEAEACSDMEDRNIKLVSSTIAAWIAVFSEVAKNAFIFLFIALLLPDKKKEETGKFDLYKWVMFPITVIHWLKSLHEKKILMEAATKGQTSARLEFDERMRQQRAEETFFVVDAVSLMRNIKFNQLAALINFEKYTAGKNVDLSDIQILSLLLCRLYQENTQIPITRTIATLKEKARSDKQFIKSVIDGLMINDSDLSAVVDDVAKPHRLHQIVLPMFASVGLVNMTIKTGAQGGKVYHWFDDKLTEDVFKEAFRARNGMVDLKKGKSEVI